MGSDHELREPVKVREAVRADRPWRFLFAHDATAPTCNLLIRAIERSMRNVDIIDAPSIDHALSELEDAMFDACFVCLDLPPAPVGGARLAEQLLREGCPVVLVTRSLRWLPQNAARLRAVPWVTPDASASQVSKVVSEALAEAASRIPGGMERFAREEAFLYSRR